MESLATRFQRQRWVLLYERAVSEIDDRNRLDLIAAATGAIFQRKRQLLQLKLAHIDELATLDDAAYILAGLRRAAEFNRVQKSR